MKVQHSLIKNSIYPLYKTGWFYLFIVFLFICLFWGNIGGTNPLNPLSQFNLYLFSAQNNETSQVVRLETPLNEQHYINLEKMLLKYPDTPMVIVGTPTKSFSKRLKGFLHAHPRSSKIIISAKQSSMPLAIPVVERSMFSGLLSWFRTYPEVAVDSMTAGSLIYSYFIVNELNEIPMIWQMQDKTYLTLPGEILRELSADKNLQLEEGWQLQLSNSQQQWPLGFSGNIVVAGDIPVSQSLEVFVQSRTLSQAQLFIIDDGRQAAADQISLVAQRLLSHHYLHKTVWMSLVNVTLFLAGIYLIWFIRHAITVMQLKVVMAYLGLLVGLQYYYMIDYLWFDVMPTLIILLVIWLIGFGYKQEYKSVTTTTDQYHDLLFDKILTLSTSHHIKALNELLSKTIPNKILLELVVDFALKLQVEGQHHAANILFDWSVASKIEYPDLKDKIAVFEQARLTPSIHPLVDKPTLVSTFTASFQERVNDQQNQQSQQQQLLNNKNQEDSHPIVASQQQYQTQPIKLMDVQPEYAAEDELEQTMVITAGQTTPSLAATSKWIAEKFGRYQVEGLLGKGAMGIVYQGVDPKINRHVAIKSLQLNESLDIGELDEARLRFFKEAETAGRLSHANIVTIYDVGEEGSLGYIAMDLLTGAPLSHFIKPENLLPAALVYQLMIQITDALDYAHRQNVVHRDIKPGNIIYDDDVQKVTVTDFGIAYVTDNSKTSTGVIMGSPYYMSPEQILGKQVDGRSDIFSLGVTFYQLLSGCLPFEGDSVVSVVYQISNEKHRAVTLCNVNLPASAARITNKALHKEVDKRYQSMQEFKQALISALKRDFKKVPLI